MSTFFKDNYAELVIVMRIPWDRLPRKMSFILGTLKESWRMLKRNLWSISGEILEKSWFWHWEFWHVNWIWFNSILREELCCVIYNTFILSCLRKCVEERWKPLKSPTWHYEFSFSKDDWYILPVSLLASTKQSQCCSHRRCSIEKLLLKISQN